MQSLPAERIKLDLYKEAFRKYKKTLELKDNYVLAITNWGTNLGHLAKLTSISNPKEAKSLYKEAFDKLEKAIEYGDDHYNLSCIYAIKGEKENALKHLDTTLSNKSQTIDFIKKDKDWKDYLEDKDFMELLEKYN